jgi:hypothetical protein
VAYQVGDKYDCSVDDRDGCDFTALIGAIDFGSKCLQPCFDLLLGEENAIEILEL